MEKNQTIIFLNNPSLRENFIQELLVKQSNGEFDGFDEEFSDFQNDENLLHYAQEWFYSVGSRTVSSFEICLRLSNFSPFLNEVLVTENGKKVTVLDFLFDHFFEEESFSSNDILRKIKSEKLKVSEKLLSFHGNDLVLLG